ncbi:hypothetical protein [Sulfurimonas sp. HSL3-7]|uniref:hypothetical protein n=1 Tax=Sulfonitrofixus jiaomeiensis TaxID=3131938 RepID=UPI0031F97F07
MKKEILISALAAGMLTMTGCGGSSDSSGDDAPTTLSAQFIDAAVEGLNYECQASGKSGVTDSDGYFNYVAGDICTFKIGTVELGSAEPTGPIFTPRDLSSDPLVVTNTLRLLQTLDTDEDPSNGITLPSDVIGTIDLGADFDAEINNFLAENNVDAAVVTEEDAAAHFEESLAEEAEAQVQEELQDHIDTTVTFQSVLASGLYYVDGYSYTDSTGTVFSETYMSKFTLANGVETNYEYNATTDSFEIYVDEYDSYQEIRLVNGAWVSKTWDEWNANQTYTFSGDNELAITGGIEPGTVTLTAYNAAGLSIAPLFEYSTDLGLSSDAVFSSNAKVYELGFTETDFTPNYSIDYWENWVCDTNGVCTEETNVNGNYEEDWTVDPAVPYTSLAKFINDKTLSPTNGPASGYGINGIWLWTEHASYLGFFSSNNTIVLYNNTYPDYSKLDVEGSYELKTVDGTEILVLNLPEIVREEWKVEENMQLIYSVQDGAVRSGGYQYASAAYNTGTQQEYNEVAARDIYTLITASSSAQAPARTSATLQENPAEAASLQQAINRKKAYMRNQGR